jgi:hypothetical protein
VCPSTIHVSWTDMPHPWARAPCLMLFLVSIIVTLMGVSMGSFNLSVCPCLPKGRWVHSLGVLPSFPTLSQMQPKSSSSIAREEGCVPPWVCTCHHHAPRCSCPHPNIFVFPTDCFLLVLFVCSIVESSQGAHALGGCLERPYILPH